MEMFEDPAVVTLRIEQVWQSFFFCIHVFLLVRKVSGNFSALAAMKLLALPPVQLL